MLKEESLSQSRKIMERKASDNKYLHKDFHVSMNMLLTYIYENFGKKELINYLSQYAEAFYKPLNQELLLIKYGVYCNLKVESKHARINLATDPEQQGHDLQ